MWNGRGAEIDENKRAELHVQSCIPRILCGASLAHLAHSFYWETCYHRGICKFGEFRWYQGSALVHCRSVTNCVQLFVTPCVATHQAFLFFIISRVCSYSCPLSWWCYLTISSSAALFFCLQSFPASVFSNESTFHIRWPKYWSFSFSISPSIEYSELISFRIDWFDLLVVQGILMSLLQHHSSKASILRHSAFFMVQLSHPYMITGETIALTLGAFVGKVMSLLFNTM